MGVSPSTVSFVLNGKDKEMRISTELAEKIRQTAKDENYHPNQVAVSLRTGKSKIIGLMVDAISGNFFASLARVIEREVESLGYKVIYCSTGNEPEKARSLIKMFHQYHVDGYIIIPSEGMENEIEGLMVKKQPLVLIDSYFKGSSAPFVMVNNFNGASGGVAHLIQKGYKKIAFVGNNLNLVQMQERLTAYTDTLKTNKIKANKKLILQIAYGSSDDDIIKKITTFIEQQNPDAIFFAANYLGVCGLESISILKLQIPRDIAVVCFDDHEVFRLYPPGITCVQQPLEEIARSAVDILMGEMKVKKKVKLKQLQIEAHIIERAST